MTGTFTTRRSIGWLATTSAALTIAACAGSSLGGSGPTLGSPDAPPFPTSATEMPSRTPTASASFVITTGIVGSWHRSQSCAEMRAAFEAAGLAESHREWLGGNFFASGAVPKTGDVCAGAGGPFEHDHLFVADGRFASHDDHGAQVDDGDVVLNAASASFPSHAREFSYDGQLTVGYAIDGDVLTFDVALPDSCSGRCADAYAWALSAFASGPWARGSVP